MSWQRCKVCGFTQSRKREVLEHIQNNHPPESLVEETNTLGRYP